MVRNHAEHKSREPDDQAQKRERLRSPPLTTVVAAAQTDAAPSPRAPAARAIEPDDEQREDGGPACCEDFSLSATFIVGLRSSQLGTYADRSHTRPWSIWLGSSR